MIRSMMVVRFRRVAVSSTSGEAEVIFKRSNNLPMAKIKAAIAKILNINMLSSNLLNIRLKAASLYFNIFRKIINENKNTVKVTIIIMALINVSIFIPLLSLFFAVKQRILKVQQHLNSAIVQHICHYQ